MSPALRRASEIDYTVVDESMRARCPPDTYPVVARLRNDTGEEMDVWLEQLPQQLFLSPGHEVEFLARPATGPGPRRAYGRGPSRSVRAGNLADPDWHLRFKGHLIRLAYQTRLSDFDAIEGDLCALSWAFEPRPRVPAAGAARPPAVTP